MSNQYYPDNTYSVSESAVNAFMTKVFGWLFLGLLVTAATSAAFIYSLFTSEAVMELAANSFFFYGMLIGELVLVFYISRSLQKISTFTAKMLFLLYAAINGITLSYVCLSFGLSDLTRAFLMTAVFFGIMCVYGLISKTDFTSVGKILMVGLMAIIISTVINFFLGSSSLDYLICIVGLGFFIGLTAYDTQKIKTHYFSEASVSGEEMSAKIAIYGALQLYLDFINMFLYILRLLGRKK